MQKGLSGSAIYHGLALSPVALATPGSSAPHDLRNYSFLTVSVAANSADLSVYVLRSGTSNGTFQGTGLSLTSVASGLAVRSMPLESSAVFYKAFYDNGNAGSITASIVFEAQAARRVPITQNSLTTVYSTVIP